MKRPLLHRSGTRVGGLLLMLTDRGIPWWGLALCYVVGLWAEQRFAPDVTP